MSDSEIYTLMIIIMVMITVWRLVNIINWLKDIYKWDIINVMKWNDVMIRMNSSAIYEGLT
jgi:hypothetical protein